MSTKRARRTGFKVTQKIGEARTVDVSRLLPGQVLCHVCGQPGTIDMKDARDRSKEGVKINHPGRLVSCRDLIKKVTK